MSCISIYRGSHSWYPLPLPSSGCRQQLTVHELLVGFIMTRLQEEATAEVPQLAWRVLSEEVVRELARLTVEEVAG